MATPNYSYEKRQRELAKKRKAEEKRQRKLNRDPNAPSTGPEDAPPAEGSAPDAGKPEPGTGA